MIDQDFSYAIWKNGLERLKVVHLRNILVEEFQFLPQETQQIKGKKTLIQTIHNEEEKLEQLDDNILDDLETSINTLTNGITDTTKINDNTKVHIPLPSDPEWTEYVLGQLTEDEIINDKKNPTKQYPTTNGLRRMVEKLIGTIVKLHTSIHQVPTIDNERRATVSVNICIIPHDVQYQELLEFSSAADVYTGNSYPPFSNHPIATADTRAEGRAYKRALKIKTSTYEEVIGTGGLSDENIMNTADQLQTGLIKPDQINFIDILCQRLDINIHWLINNLIPDFSQLPNQLPYDKACDLLAIVQKYQGKGKDVKEITEDMKGYNSNWQNKSINNKN